MDEATSSIDILGSYNDQWNSVSSTEKWTFGENSWQDLLYVVEEVADQRNYFRFTIYVLMASASCHCYILTLFIHVLIRLD